MDIVLLSNVTTDVNVFGDIFRILKMLWIGLFWLDCLFC